MELLLCAGTIEESGEGCEERGFTITPKVGPKNRPPVDIGHPGHTADVTS
jgi:hypothetical protein